MSAIRTALYQRLSTDSELRALLGAPDAIYYGIAPAKSKIPYLILNKQTGNPDWSFGGRDDVIQSERWLVKAVCVGGSASPAEAAADRADELLHDAPLSIDGATLLYCRRVSDVNYPETSGSDRYWHVGSIYAVVTAPTAA